MKISTDLLTRLNLCHPDVRVHELTQERARKGPYGMLSRAVDATPDVGLAACNGAQVDNVPRILRLEVCDTRSVLRRTIIVRRRTFDK